MIRSVRQGDAEQIADIYNYYVRKTISTFEEQPVLAEEMAMRVAKTVKSWPWMVWEEGPAVLGYAYAGCWQERSAYRYTGESTVYVRSDCLGRGIGSALYRHLIDELRGRDLHAVIGGISLPNPASAALHEKIGFRKVAHFPELGFKFNRWIDVGYWQLTF